MKSFTAIFRFILLVLFLMVIFSRVSAQTEDDLDCYFSADTANQVSLESIPVLQDTSLRIAILFVQFADYQANPNARGSVGWDHYDSSQAQIVERKYRYYHFWEMYFTRNTYIDIDPSDPQIHPDAESHNIPGQPRIAVYGSFRDYYHEVSHGELDTQPAVTHPAESDSMFPTGRASRTPIPVEWLNR